MLMPPVTLRSSSSRTLQQTKICNHEFTTKWNHNIATRLYILHTIKQNVNMEPAMDTHTHTKYRGFRAEHSLLVSALSLSLHVWSDHHVALCLLMIQICCQTIILWLFLFFALPYWLSKAVGSFWLCISWHNCWTVKTSPAQWFATVPVCHTCHFFQMFLENFFLHIIFLQLHCPEIHPCTFVCLSVGVHVSMHFKLCMYICNCKIIS